MKKLLKELNEGVGVRGSLVMTRDGVVAASCLGDEVDENALAALTSSVLLALEGSPGRDLSGEAVRFTLSAKHGRLIFEILESLVLVVVTDKDIQLDITLLEIAGMGRRLQRMTRISV